MNSICNDDFPVDDINFPNEDQVSEISNENSDFDDEEVSECEDLLDDGAKPVLDKLESKSNHSNSYSFNHEFQHKFRLNDSL